MDNDMEPDERALVQDLESVRFLSGVDRGYWRVADRAGTMVTLELTSRAGRRVGVRLDCAGYPGAAPTGQLWSVSDAVPLPVEDWPSGGRADQVFNPTWSVQNGGAFYFPFDRRARVGHDAWARDHTGHVWSIDKTVIDVLHLLREVLSTASGPSIRTTQEDAAS
jgi:hypothetical protein